MSPITLSTAVITLFSVDNIVAMEDSKSIKTDVDLNNGIDKIVSDTINDNIKAKAKLLSVVDLPLTARLKKIGINQ